MDVRIAAKMVKKKKNLKVILLYCISDGGSCLL